MKQRQEETVSRLVVVVAVRIERALLALSLSSCAAPGLALAEENPDAKAALAAPWIADTMAPRSSEPVPLNDSARGAAPAHSGRAGADQVEVAKTPADVQAKPRTARQVEAAIAAQEKAADGWAIEDAHFRVAAFYQNGRGYQSQAGKTTFTNTYQKAPVGSRGIEEAWILEPLMLFDIRQNKKIHHEVYIPVDIVSAASPDGVDLVAHASRVNESFAVDVTSTYQASDILDMSFRWGVHVEEPLRSLDAGPSFTLHLAENNSVVTVSALVVADGFDPLDIKGNDLGYTSRTTFSANLSYSQILSPTTLFDGSIGTTEQWGTLQTTWNSVVVHRGPEEEGESVYRVLEQFPSSRNRDAAFARISQHIPLTHSTVKASYRFYWDENHAYANTGEVMLYQYLAPWFYVRAHGRLHQQHQPDFWVSYLVSPFRPTVFRTSDSDLQTLVSREAGLKLVLLRDKAPAKWRGPDSFDIGYLHYQRSNSLHEDYASIGYSRSF